MTTTFDAAFQEKLLAFQFRDAAFAQRVEGVLTPEAFDQETHSFLIDFANRHFGTYRTPPDAAILIREIKDAKVSKRIKDEFITDLKPVIARLFAPGVDLSNRDFYVDQVSKFARQRAMEAALTQSVDILEGGGDFAEIEKKITAAQAVGAHEGTSSRDLYDSIEDRIEARIKKAAGTVVRGVTTGHRELNDLLYHKGWGRKELSLLMGGAKTGKSMGLAHFALKAVEYGQKVLFTTHENSAEVALDRMDAAVAGVEMRKLDSYGPQIKDAVERLHARGGLLKMEEFPAGQARVADIAKLLHRHAASGITFDLLVVDYADELRATRRYDEERFSLKEIYTSLRALASTEDIAILSATQTNRSGNKALTATATDVGEDWSKMKIADCVITINANEEERKRNEMRLYLALMRNSQADITVTCSTDRSKMRFINSILKVT
jgi:replicative DNA helicase